MFVALLENTLLPRIYTAFLRLKVAHAAAMALLVR